MYSRISQAWIAYKDIHRISPVSDINHIDKFRRFRSKGIIDVPFVLIRLASRKFNLQFHIPRMHLCSAHKMAVIVAQIVYVLSFNADIRFQSHGYAP